MLQFSEVSLNKNIASEVSFALLGSEYRRATTKDSYFEKEITFQWVHTPPPISGLPGHTAYFELGPST